MASALVPVEGTRPGVHTPLAGAQLFLLEAGSHLPGAQSDTEQSQYRVQGGPEGRPSNLLGEARRELL